MEKDSGGNPLSFGEAMEAVAAQQRRQIDPYLQEQLDKIWAELGRLRHWLELHDQDLASTRTQAALALANTSTYPRSTKP